MAKVRHDEIIPECNIDTNLIETLLKVINLERKNYDEYIVQHSRGIGEVTRTMQTAKKLKDGFALGVVDDDPKFPNYKNLFKRLSKSGEINLVKNLLDKFVNEREGLTEDDLKQVFKDAGY